MALSISIPLRTSTSTHVSCFVSCRQKSSRIAVSSLSLARTSTLSVPSLHPYFLIPDRRYNRWHYTSTMAKYRTRITPAITSFPQVLSCNSYLIVMALSLSFISSSTKSTCIGVWGFRTHPTPYGSSLPYTFYSSSRSRSRRISSNINNYRQYYGTRNTHTRPEWTRRQQLLLLQRQQFPQGLWMASTSSSRTTATSSSSSDAAEKEGEGQGMGEKQQLLQGGTEFKYPHAAIEKKWQDYWEEHNTFETPIRTPATTGNSRPKKYVLDMFPYPSGAGLHVGHPLGYTASDVMARYYRMRGFDVLHPMGWDSFGLPAEQFAIQTGTPPAITTKKNIETFQRQMKTLGFSYDWQKELATTDETYYRWTQWIFLQLFRRGLASQDYVAVNWCPALGTVLANEEIINGLSERGSHPVQRIPLRQWVLKITEYADILEEGLNGLDWPTGTMVAQRQWIGKSVGCIIDFPLEGNTHEDDGKISVFTTRADTVMGVTYVTLAPEHPLVDILTTEEQREAVSNYVKATVSKSDLDRTASKEKTGVFTGGYVYHPIDPSIKVPVWISDYVLGGYGTGAVMAVPAHDDRDYEFAQKYGLDIKFVIKPQSDDDGKNCIQNDNGAAYTEPGITFNSGEVFSGITTDEAKVAIAEHLHSIGRGGLKTNYKLRDWVFSRQRYWGEPIPIYFPVSFPEEIDPTLVDLQTDTSVKHTIHYDQPIPVPEEELPLTLPAMTDYQPGDDPAGCLARAREWRYFKHPSDGKWYARETNTMPQWAGSCWYYFRYLDPKNSKEAFTKEMDEAWMPVDLYVGGAEHAVLHLLYARFWHRVLYDMGYTKHPEPFQKLVHQGMILGADGEKMSKSRGNVINPDDVVSAHGGDALRLYEMFMGPLEAVKPWQTSQVAGVVRFRDKVYNLVNEAARHRNVSNAVASDNTKRLLHKTMKKVTEDIEAMAFNTAISALMVLTNHLQSLKDNVPLDVAEKLAVMVSPFAPHLGEECWSLLGHTESLAYHQWVEWDESLCVDNTVKIGVQVNGKVRGEIEIAKDSSQELAVQEALRQERVAFFLDGKAVKKVIYVPGRILNIVAT